jgi:small conductance mechanosensitive channel
MIGKLALAPAVVAPLARYLREDVGLSYGAGTIATGVVFIGSFLLVWYVGRAVLSPTVNRMLNARGLDTHAKKPIQKLVSYGVLFVAVTVAFGAAQLGNFLQAFATIGAAATLAIGFALQDVIKNFVAGIFIYTDKPFRIGDWIEWGDSAGVVEDISLRVTRVRTFDNELLTVPNGQLMSDVIKNPVAKDTLRLKFVFGIGYDDNIEKATEIIVEEAQKHDDILEDPGPSVRLVELGDSSVGLQSRIWIADPGRSDFTRIRGEYVTAVKQRFDEEDINFPYPNRTIGGGLELENVEGLVEG